MDIYLQAKATFKDGVFWFVFQYELLHVPRPQDYVESSRLSNICKEMALYKGNFTFISSAVLISSFEEQQKRGCEGENVGVIG